MRWFKHMTAASDDEKLALFVNEFGMSGYGFYWRLLELIAAQMDGASDKCEVRYPARLLRSYLIARGLLFNKKMERLNSYGLVFNKSDGDTILLSCPNLLKYRDEYSAKKARQECEISGHTPDNIRTHSGHSVSASSQEGKPNDDIGGNPFDEAVKAAAGAR